MMRPLCLIPTLLVIFWATLPELEARSLAEAAREERRRRAQQRSSGKVFTNEDLSQYGSRFKHRSSSRANASPTPSQSTSPSPQSTAADEERQWSQQFIEARAKVKAARQRQELLQARITDLNQKLQGNPLTQTTVADPANVYGPLISQARQQIQQNDLALTTAEQELADLREALRKSGKPLSWENSQAALRPETSSDDGENRQEPKARDQAYWKKRLALIDKRYDSQITPFEVERFQLIHRRLPLKGESLAVESNPGLGLPPQVIDIDIQIKQLRRQQTREKQALIEQALRSGALPGWFR